MSGRTLKYKSFLFPNVCFIFSDLLLKWPEKDGFKETQVHAKQTLTGIPVIRLNLYKV
jgi:hypothetical protein